MLLVSCILWIIWMVRYGFSFNQLYLAYVEKQKQEPQPKSGPSGKRLSITIAIVVVCCVLYAAITSAATMAVFEELASVDSYEEMLILSDESTEETEETEPEPEPLPEETPDTQETPSAFSGTAPPASASLKVVRYATNNGRITEVPSADQVCEVLEAMDYSGYLAITPGETGGFFSPRNNVYTTQLYVDIYQDPWTYLQSVTMYYTYFYDENGPHDFSIIPDSIETFYDEERYLALENYEFMNECDTAYYGDTPTPGMLWCDPVTGEWSLDGELLEEGGGLYWY